MNETKALAIHVLKWLDRNNLGDTDLREVMDLVGNYDYALESAVERIKEYNMQYKTNKLWEERMKQQVD